MSLLLLFHPGVAGGSTPTPTPAASPAATSYGAGGARWGIENRKRRLRAEDAEIGKAVLAMAWPLMRPRLKLDTDEDLLALIRSLAPDFMKNRKRKE